MQRRRELEELADAILEPHRTAPPRRPATEDGTDPLKDWPLARFLVRLSSASPDPEALDRVRRHQRRHALFQRWDNAMGVVTIVVLCVGAAVWFTFL